MMGLLSRGIPAGCVIVVPPPGLLLVLSCTLGICQHHLAEEQSGKLGNPGFPLAFPAASTVCD